MRQIALEPRYQSELQALVDSVTRALTARGINAAAYVESALTGPAVANTLPDVSRAVASGFGNLVLTLLIFAFKLGRMWEMERRANKQARDHSPLAARFLAFAGTIRGYMRRADEDLGAAPLPFRDLLGVGTRTNGRHPLCSPHRAQPGQAFGPSEHPGVGGRSP